MKNSDLIFIVEDDKFYAKVLKSFLEFKGFNNIIVFNTGKEAIENLYQCPAFVLLDYRLEDMNGQEVLLEVMAFDPNIPVVFLSGQSSIQKAIGTLKIGAFDYLMKDDLAFEKLESILANIQKSKSELASFDRSEKMKRYKAIMLVVVAIILSSAFLF